MSWLSKACITHAFGMVTCSCVVWHTCQCSAESVWHCVQHVDRHFDIYTRWVSAQAAKALISNAAWQYWTGRQHFCPSFPQTILPPHCVVVQAVFTASLHWHALTVHLGDKGWHHSPVATAATYRCYSFNQIQRRPHMDPANFLHFTCATSSCLMGYTKKQEGVALIELACCYALHGTNPEEPHSCPGPLPNPNLPTPNFHIHAQMRTHIEGFLTRWDHFLQGAISADLDTAAVVRPCSAFHETVDGVELAAHLLHHSQRSLAHRLHGHGAEPEGKHGANKKASKHLYKTVLALKQRFADQNSPAAVGFATPAHCPRQFPVQLGMFVAGKGPTDNCYVINAP